MATHQDSNTPARSNDNQNLAASQHAPSPLDAPDMALEAAAAEAGMLSNADVPRDAALEAAVRLVGENPSEAARLAEELGLSFADAKQTAHPEEPAPDTAATESKATEDDQTSVKLCDSNPDGPPMRISHDNRTPCYALRHSGGLLVAEDYEKPLTGHIDGALIADSYGMALRLRDIYKKHRFEGEELEIVRVLVGYKGRPYGVASTEGPPEKNDWTDLNRYTAAMASAAAYENAPIGLEAFISHSQHLAQSPLWPLLKAQFDQDTEADAKERDEWDWESAPLNLYTRGLMAGIQLQRMLGNAKNKYGELVAEVPQRGEIDLGRLKEKR